MERTFVILKPDAVRRKLVGEIITRFEKRNIKIAQIKVATIEKPVIEEHYAHVKHIPIYNDMIGFMTGGPVVMMILEGEDVVKMVRTMMGKTMNIDSLPGTIRGDYGYHDFENLIHGSDSPENAEIEIKRFFG